MIAFLKKIKENLFLLVLAIFILMVLGNLLDLLP